MNRYAATIATAALVACAALGVTYGAIASTRPAPAPDTSAIVAAEARADAAEKALSDALAAQGDTDATARYTACMYALNTLDPGADMTDAAWSCTRNLDTFAVLTPGQAWDARDYNER